MSGTDGENQTTTVDAVIKAVFERSVWRTRYPGMPPYQDEILVDEICRLRSDLSLAKADIARLERIVGDRVDG